MSLKIPMLQQYSTSVLMLGSVEGVAKHVYTPADVNEHTADLHIYILIMIIIYDSRLYILFLLYPC